MTGLNGRLHRLEIANYLVRRAACMQELGQEIDFPVTVASLSKQRQTELWNLFLWLDGQTALDHEQAYRRFDRFLFKVTI